MCTPIWQKFSINSSTTFWYWEVLLLPRKFAVTNLRDNQAESLAGFSASSKQMSLMSSLIWGPSNMPTCLKFSPCFFVETSDEGKEILYLPCPMPLQSSSWDRVLCGGVESLSSFIQPEDKIERTLCDPGFNPCLDGCSYLA